jgi:hypothetical protein
LNEISEDGARLQAASAAAEQKDIRIAIKRGALLVRGRPETRILGFFVLLPRD